MKRRVTFVTLLILRFGDEVNFSAGFPALPVGSLGRHIPSAWLLFLLGLPTPSSSSPLILWVGPGFPSGWLSGYQLADGPTLPSYSVAQVPIFLRVFRDRSQPSGKTKLAKIPHFDLSQKAEKKSTVCLLLILRFGDEVDFSAGFPARPVGSLRQPIPSAWLIVLLGLPTPSSTPPLILGSDLGSLSAGFPAISWLMDLLGHPTQSPKCRFF